MLYKYFKCYQNLKTLLNFRERCLRMYKMLLFLTTQNLNQKTY